MRRDRMRLHVGLALLEQRNTWVSVPELAFQTGASVRQVYAIVHCIPDADLEIVEHSWGKSMFLKADLKEAGRIWSYFIAYRYKRDNLMSEICKYIPDEGWGSACEIANIVGISMADVKYALQYVEGLECKELEKDFIFKRVGENVYKCSGVAESGDCVSE